MNSSYKRQLPPTAIPANFKQTDQQATDFGAHRVLEVYIKILKAGPALGKVFLSTNATLDPDNWVPLTTTELAQNATTPLFVPVEDFLRYIRAEGNGSGDGTCIAMADIVAKD